MSFKALKQVYDLARELSKDDPEAPDYRLSLTAGELDVLRGYAYHANRETGESFPRHATLGGELFRTEQFIQRASRKLERLALLKRVGTRKSGTAVYRLDLSPENVGRVRERVENEVRRQEAKKIVERQRKALENREKVLYADFTNSR